MPGRGERRRPRAGAGALPAHPAPVAVQRLAALIARECGTGGATRAGAPASSPRDGRRGGAVGDAVLRDHRRRPRRAASALSMAGGVLGAVLANQFGFDGTAYAANLLAGVPGRVECSPRGGRSRGVRRAGAARRRRRGRHVIGGDGRAAGGDRRGVRRVRRVGGVAVDHVRAGAVRVAGDEQPVRNEQRRRHGQERARAVASLGPALVGGAIATPSCCGATALAGPAVGARPGARRRPARGGILIAGEGWTSGRRRCSPRSSRAADDGHDRGVTIHSTDPFATPEEERSPVRRFRGRLPAAVTLWTAPGPAGLTVSSTLVAAGDPGRVLGLVDDESDLWTAIEASGVFTVTRCSTPADRNSRTASPVCCRRPGAFSARPPNGAPPRGPGAGRAPDLGRLPPRRGPARRLGAPGRGDDRARSTSATATRCCTIGAGTAYRAMSGDGRHSARVDDHSAHR